MQLLEHEFNTRDVLSLVTGFDFGGKGEGGAWREVLEFVNAPSSQDSSAPVVRQHIPSHDLQIETARAAVIKQYPELDSILFRPDRSKFTRDELRWMANGFIAEHEKSLGSTLKIKQSDSMDQVINWSRAINHNIFDDPHVAKKTRPTVGTLVDNNTPKVLGGSSVNEAFQAPKSILSNIKKFGRSLFGFGNSPA